MHHGADNWSYMYTILLYMHTLLMVNEIAPAVIRLLYSWRYSSRTVDGELSTVVSTYIEIISSHYSIDKGCREHMKCLPVSWYSRHNFKILVSKQKHVMSFGLFENKQRVCSHQSIWFINYSNQDWNIKCRRIQLVYSGLVRSLNLQCKYWNGE